MASINRKIERKKNKLNPFNEIVKMIKNGEELLKESFKPEKILEELKFNIVESEETKDDIKYVNGILTTLKSSREKMQKIIDNLKKLTNIKKPKEEDVINAVDDAMSLGETSVTLEKAIRDTYTIFQSLEKESTNAK